MSLLYWTLFFSVLGNAVCFEPVVFVKCVKCGGTTLALFLERLSKFINVKGCFRKGCAGDALEYPIIASHTAKAMFQKYPEIYNGSQLITIVREPKEAILSSLFFDLHNRGMISKMNLDEMWEYCSTNLAKIHKSVSCVPYLGGDKFQKFDVIGITSKFNSFLSVLFTLWDFHGNDTILQMVPDHLKRFDSRPTFREVPLALQKRIEKITREDMILYNKAVVQFDNLLKTSPFKENNAAFTQKLKKLHVKKVLCLEHSHTSKNFVGQDCYSWKNENSR